MIFYNEIFGWDMLFHTFTDFMNIRDKIKSKLKDKDAIFRVTYRMYVESRPFIKDFYRGLIWDYLNDYVSEQDLLKYYKEYQDRIGDTYE